MKDAMRSTRSSKRLEGLKAVLFGTSGSGQPERVAKTASAAIAVERYNLPNEVYILWWNLSKTSRLTSLEERKEWLDNMMAPGARTKFETYKEA